MIDHASVFETLRGKTAPQLLAEHARAKPGAVAFRSKHRGLYRERTWHDYAVLVGRCALGFRALGLNRPPDGRLGEVSGDGRGRPSRLGAALGINATVPSLRPPPDAERWRADMLGAARDAPPSKPEAR